MAYSRWGSSRWYTFWHIAGKKDEHNKDKQIFDVCTVKHFTYKELKEDIDACVKEADKMATKIALAGDSYPPNDEEMEELKGYMEEFIRDVEEDERFRDPLHEDLKKVAKFDKEDKV